MKFINKQDLLSHGNKKLRTDILKVIDYAIKNVDPYTSTINLVKIKNNILYIGQSSYDLSKKQNIYVLGAGKASLSIAIALEKLLQDKITGGIIIIKKGQYTKKLKKIQIIEASHPIPDKKGFEGAKAIIELTNKINNNDLVFTLITGGSSALAPLPEDGISLEDKIETNKLLLESGANILEINNIRKHISKIKGGRLAKNYLSHTQIINFIVSDVVGNNIKHESDWVMPDESTASDALNTLQKYNLLNKIPSTVINHLNTVSQNPDLESPNMLSFKNLNIDTFVLTNINKACEAAFHKAKNLGYNSMILNNMLQGESKDIGIILSSIAKECIKTGLPLQPPCIIILGGETTVSLKSFSEIGGRNQEMALSAAIKLNNLNRVVLATFNTDGSDGPTDAAGGLIDGKSYKIGQNLGIDFASSLKTHASYNALKKINDIIITGSTGTNVMDIIILGIN